ncbi:Coiled-coil domain-containing protein 124-like [Lachnellula cervina]|uniref:Coiled-coil domain-containing protein 124-like n=1 Tax=Lachnellula cervina TaxID=1316786 RepID=A0A7D8YQI7_9HELO|nr:Coiled-coil domain-containing protein 124-like [Lachnellula cervina]
MAGKKAVGENSRKVAGNSKKAEVAAQKAAAENQKKAVVEDEDWGRGAKSNAKKEAETAKKAEQARKKAEKDALLAEEEKDARPAPKNAKQAVKKTKGLDLSQLDDDAGPSSKKASALNATGIDNALDALSLTTDSASAKIDKHPERRFKAAYAAFEERRLKEMDEDGSGQGLRQNQKKDKIRKEFEKSEENPFNQVSAAYDTTKEELRDIKEREKSKIEGRLGN